MALNYPRDETCCKYSALPSELDVPIKSILLMHDPDGRDLDSEMLLRVIEIIMYHATESQDFNEQQDSLDMSSAEVFESQLDNSVYRISCEILCNCYGEENLHASTISVLNLLGRYRWDAKLLLALSAFATLYGEFWVIMQLKSHNSLAASMALLKQFPNSIDIFKPIFIVLVALVKTVVEVIRSVMQFEGLPIAYLELQDDAVATTKCSTYVAAYWVLRTILVCTSLIMNLKAIKDITDEDPYSVSSVVWEITSLKAKISRIGAQLRAQVDVCQQLTEQKMHKKLVSVFQETHSDNQEVLRMLFALKNDFPLKQTCEQPKVGISLLKNKVVMLLLSEPEILPMEELLLLVHQTYNHPNSQLDGSYEILWIPISAAEKWRNNEVTVFNFLSNSLPWYSIRQPWSISSITVKYAKKEWKYNGKPLMVVLDSIGRIINTNALGMLWIWGAKAYPFSASREKELWEEEIWNLKLLLDNIDPLLAIWVEEGRTLCIYGSNNLEWIRDFRAKIGDIQRLVARVEVVYVGKKDRSELANNLTSITEKEELSKSLSSTKKSLFWHRLESMKRSKLRLGQTTTTDHILKEVEALLHEDHNNEEWVIIGKGSSTNMVKLHGSEWVRFLNQSLLWEKYLPEIGLVDAIRLSLRPPLTKPCSHPRITKYNEGLMGNTVICEKCNHLMQKLIMYDVE